MSDWVNLQIKQFPQANKKVLSFIETALTFFPNDKLEYNSSPEYYFSCGFCYHFAVILQNLFGGKILWHKFHSHIVWADEDGFTYDAHGVFSDWGKGDLLPISVLSDIDLKLFQHIEHFSKKEIAQGQLQTAKNVLCYEIENHAEVEQLEVTKKVIKGLSSKTLIKEFS